MSVGTAADVAPGRFLTRVGTALLLFTCAQCGGDTPTKPTPSSSGTAPPTAPGPQFPIPLASPQIFVGAGDIGMCGSPGPELTAKLLDGIAGTVFTLGDNAYSSGTAREYRDCYDPSWGRHKNRTRPVPGNHEYESPGAAPYFDYFGFNAGPGGLGYYSFDLGAWHAVALNSNISALRNSVQGQWLRADLAATQSRCTIAYWHHPLFTSGPDGDSVEMRDFWRILYEAGAELVLVGHDHDYERFAPQNPDGGRDPARGIREFVVGTGGATPYPFVNIQANSEARLTGLFGVLKLALHADGYQWEFVSPSGVGDAGAGSCH
jgi:hypothetical protein